MPLTELLQQQRESLHAAVLLHTTLSSLLRATHDGSEVQGMRGQQHP